MAGYAVDMALSPRWQWCLFCGLPLAAVLFLAFIFIAPYSPRWLLAKGRQAEARAVLLLIRDADEVEAELEAIEKTRDESKDINMKTAFAAPHVRWSVMLGVAMAFIQQWTGCNAVNMCKFLPNKNHISSHLPAFSRFYDRTPATITRDGALVLYMTVFCMQTLRMCWHLRVLIRRTAKNKQYTSEQLNWSWS
jgi:MFS family permease